MTRLLSPRDPAFAGLRPPPISADTRLWVPVIFQRSEQTFQLKAGLSQDPYLDRWLIITAVLAMSSAVVYAARLVRAGRAD